MESILNICQLTERITCAGQPGAEQFALIAEAGYSVLINLAMSDASNAVPEEERIVRNLGMTHVHIPVPFDAPQLSHVRAFFGVMDAFRGERVFVHCALNLRASAFLYLYLTLSDNIAPEQASTPFLTAWQPKMEAVWRDILALDRRQLNL